MVKILVSKSDGELTISMKGHAGYAEHGQDIVCASVSAIIQTALLGLQAISEQYPNNVTYFEGGKNNEKK